jgi:hypothetical protein
MTGGRPSGRIGKEGSMKSIRLVLMAAAVLVAVTLACGPLGEASTPEMVPTQEAPPTPEAQPTPVPTGTPVPELVGATLDIVNDSGIAIAYLYISPSKSTAWGVDWLGEDGIAVGAGYTVSDIPPGTYDIQAADSDQESIEVLYRVDLRDSNTWTVVGKSLLPDNAVLRFEDDFHDNRNNWGLDTEDEDVFYKRPADGEYCILIKSNSFTAWEWYEPFRPDQFVAEISCRVEGAEDSSCGLGFGPDGDNLYWFEVSPFDQTFGLFLLENGSWQDKLVDWTVSKNIDPAGSNYLSMERVESIF